MSDKKTSQVNVADDLAFRDYVVRSLTELDVKMSSLVGNGKKGRIDMIESRLQKLAIAVIVLIIGGGAASLAASTHKLEALSAILRIFS